MYHLDNLKNQWPFSESNTDFPEDWCRTFVVQLLILRGKLKVLSFIFSCMVNTDSCCNDKVMTIPLCVLTRLYAQAIPNSSEFCQYIFMFNFCEHKLMLLRLFWAQSHALKSSESRNTCSSSHGVEWTRWVLLTQGIMLMWVLSVQSQWVLALYSRLHKDQYN